MNACLKTCCLVIAIGLLSLGGCLKDPNPPAAQAEPEKKLDPTGIFGKKTTDIGEFNPDTGSKEADLAVDPNSSYTGALTGGTKYAMAEIEKMKVQHAMQLYNAMHDRYPKNLEEFMKEIIEPNQIQLQVLPGGLKYEYDVENHELKIVEGK